MLPRALQAAALAERILSGSLTQTLSQATGSNFPAGPLIRTWQRRGCSATPSALPAFSTAAPAAASDDAAGLQIHSSAAARLRELQAEKPGSRLALRIEVEGGGCSGFQYKFRLDEQSREDDIVFESEGGRVVCDAISLEFLRGATLEFEDSIMRAAFTISKNPNAEASCGCGSSFAAKMK
ncbi:hypothetical protein PLESTB_000727300 [Pleodorina starrii]|uniref:Core domain-containing protein n=1 Tax=Pleodorina starrii TaxID=330485 RepID=A0A9W6BJB6_9CHLO|nr:hypothetical protein PLESTM_000197000 [Pleodorina starrii]GLC53276.1 hypothetical protein PLESTB_000727300 [Pleodorina starrii]GLC67254.1 hypothetical protein PLESTF_000533900 [Pleodorina starrii]